MTVKCKCGGTRFRTWSTSKIICWQCNKCRKRVTQGRRQPHNDPAYESEAWLRNMEGHGDYEGPVTWP